MAGLIKSSIEDCKNEREELCKNIRETFIKVNPQTADKKNG